MRQFITRALAALLFVLMGVGILAAPAAATTGGVNIGGWCSHQIQPYKGSMRNWYYDNTKAYPLSSTDAFSWRCFNFTTQQMIGVDMNAACHYSYPWAPGNAQLKDARNPYSWYCIY